VGDTDRFQAMGPVETGEEVEIAECYDLEEKHDGTQKQKEGNKVNTSISKCREPRPLGSAKGECTVPALFSDFVIITKTAEKLASEIRSLDRLSSS
jgi:hypothetical protein